MDIEETLFKGEGQYGLDKIIMDNKSLTIEITPWESGVSKVFRFENFKLTSCSQISQDDEDLEFPWDIVGVNAKSQGSLWDFCIHCSGIEYGFVASWPLELNQE